ncbi:hypothetical protein NLI96_g10285 [Meripilus lineatus]|uniref:Uncharacterized protein n=1 Tax=Meripilus lineatus TaxID=2056292 RepID=A0AAD5UTX6_9APHY|nr:hypothetical protein NLI96_g10285 [Physisporinus lineatus]
MTQRPPTPPPLPPPPPRGLEPYRNSYTTRFFGGGPPGAVSRPPVPGDPFADSAGGSLGPSASQTRFSLDSTTPPHSYTSPGSTTRVAAWVSRTPRQIYADESV